jgi:hypothetical protein
VSTPLEDLHSTAESRRETESRRQMEERARGAEGRLRKALGEVRLLLYADTTQRDAAVAERMRWIAERLASGRPFENARTLPDYVAERDLEAHADAACRWEASDAVESWLDEQPEDVVACVLDFLFELCDEPEAFPKMHLDGEPTPRRYAAVPGTDVVIITYTVTDGHPRIVHGLKIERDTRFWAV